MTDLFVREAPPSHPGGHPRWDVIDAQGRRVHRYSRRRQAVHHATYGEPVITSSRTGCARGYEDYHRQPGMCLGECWEARDAVEADDDEGDFE